MAHSMCIVVRYMTCLSLALNPTKSIIAKSCSTDTHATHTTTHNTDQNIGGSCYPKCKQVQSFMTVSRITNVNIVRLIILIDPDIATYKPDKQETVQNGLHRPFPLLLLVLLTVTLLGPLTQ